VTRLRHSKCDKRNMPSGWRLRYLLWSLDLGEYDAG
jgi:hypothetical protein